MAPSPWFLCVTVTKHSSLPIYLFRYDQIENEESSFDIILFKLALFMLIIPKLKVKLQPHINEIHFYKSLCF